jgi:transposase
MSTSLLYHALGLKGYEYQKTEYLNGTIFFHVKKHGAYQYCTNCKSRAVSLPVGWSGCGIAYPSG